MSKDKEQPKTVSFYNRETGSFLSRSFSGPAKAVNHNTPDGCVAIEGLYDYLSQRLDLESGEVIDYQPPKPDDDHEWNGERRRWELKREVRTRQRRRRIAQQEIEALEHKQQRPMRELAIDPGHTEARRRLDKIEAEIATIRAGVIQSGS